jgi:hypothetical protein
MGGRGQAKARSAQRWLASSVRGSSTIIYCTTLRSLAGFDSPERWPLYERIRAAVYDSLLGRPPSEVFVLTNALCSANLREVEAWRHVVDLAIARQVPLIPVILEIEPAENVRRLQSADRIGRKLTDPAVLRSYFDQERLLCPDVPETCTFDVTRLSPEEAAALIKAHVESSALLFHSATKDYLRLR